MRFPSLLAVPMLLCGAIAVAASLPADMPKRKPGLWEMQVSGMAGGSQALPKICLDETTDKAMYELGTKMSGAMCSKLDIAVKGGKVIVDSICTMQMPTGPVNMTSHSETTFDGNTAYRTAGQVNYSPAFMGKTAVQVSSEGHWTGACPAGQKPGDMTMPNGSVVNISQLSN
jgi:hypothetical protein